MASAATYSVVTALSHAGLVRDHNEDSLVIGQWTLCAAETETPQTFVFPIASPLVVAVRTVSADILAVMLQAQLWSGSLLAPDRHSTANRDCGMF